MLNKPFADHIKDAVSVTTTCCVRRMPPENVVILTGGYGLECADGFGCKAEPKRLAGAVGRQYFIEGEDGYWGHWHDKDGQCWRFGYD